MFESNYDAKPRSVKAKLSVLAASLTLAASGLGVADMITANAALPTLPMPPSTAAAALSPSYSVPSGALFVATNGNDAGNGSQSAPFKSITKAISAAPAGGIIVVRGGTYRDGSTSSIYKNVTVQNYPGEQVWMDGTDVVGGWIADGNAWKVSWSTPSFCKDKYYTRHYLSQDPANSGPCTHIDMARDPANPAAGDPQMAFVNGVALKEVTTRSAVGVGSFFYDQDARVMYLGSNPSGATVELAARPNALVLQGGNGFAIKGIGFKRYATNEFSGNATHGAVLVNSPNVTLDHVAFTQQAGAGLHIADPKNAKVSNSYFGFNGNNGLDANGHYRTGERDNLIVETSMFDSNNTELFGLNCDLSCASAGSKMAHINGVTLKGNIFQNGKGRAHGYWCDLACSDVSIVNNVFKNNGGDGVFYEVSNTGIIASNLITGNGRYGIKLGSANTQVYNNTITNSGTSNVLIFDDDRTLNVGGWTDVGPDTTNVTFYNNIVGGGPGKIDMSFWRTNSTAPNTGPNTFIKGLDYNTYYRPNGTPATLIDWRDGSTTLMNSLSAVQARGFELHGVDTATDVNAGTSIAAVPAAVMSAIGTTEITRRGAVVFPGSGPIATTTTTAKPTTTTTAAPTTTTAKPTTTTAKPTTTTAKPTTTTAPAARNLLNDPSFEGPLGWRQFGSSSFGLTTSQAHSGSRSVAIRATKLTQDINGITNSPLAVNSTVAGRTYTGSCWVKASKATTALVRFHEYNTNWTQAGAPHDGAVASVGTEWKQISVTHKAVNSGKYLPFIAYSTDLHNGATLYVDDCSISAL